MSSISLLSLQFSVYHKEGAEHLVVENLCFRKQNNWLQSEKKNSAVCNALKPEVVSLFS